MLIRKIPVPCTLAISLLRRINIPMNMKNASLSAEEKDILGFNYMEPSSIAQYFTARKRKKY